MTCSFKVMSTPSTSLSTRACVKQSHVWMPLFSGNSIGSATDSDLCNYSSLSSHGYNIRALGSGCSIRSFICLLCQLAQNWWEEKTRSKDFKLSNMTPLVVFFSPAEASSFLVRPVFGPMLHSLLGY